MKIIFNKLKLNNFMSFEEAEINLDKVGYFIINGINNNKEDSASSNGSGKSTLFEALCWVLTGETIRGTKNVSNIYTDKGATVELEFSIDNDVYKLIRQKDPSNLFFYVNGEDKSSKGIRDTEKIVNQYLPDLTSSLIGSVIILGQGLPQRFTNNSPSGRKEVLEKLSKSDYMIVELKDRVSKRKSALNQQLREVEDKLLISTNNKNNAEKIIAETEEKISKLTSTDLLLKTLEGKELQLQIKTNNKRVTEESIEQLEKEAEDLLIEINSIEKTIQSDLLEIDKKYSPDINELKDRINNVNNERSILKKEIDRIHNIKDVCPTCGQKLQNVEKPDTTEQENRLECYNVELEDLQKDLDVLVNSFNTEINKVIKNQENKKNELTEVYNLHKKDLEKCKNILNENNTEILVLNDEINSIKLDINGREALNTSYKELISSNKQTLVECEKEILYYNDEQENLNKRISIINKIFSALNKEFRGYLLTNVIQYINEISKKYCYQIFNNDKLDFKLDGNNISISYCGKEYENLSGGEKQKIDIIIQFAIRNMLSKYLNFSSNILVLDEVTDFLDNQGIEAILTLITNNLKDTPAIYFITHHDDLMFPYDGEIKVIKNNNISSLIVT